MFHYIEIAEKAFRLYYAVTFGEGITEISAEFLGHAGLMLENHHIVS
jgi:hypothetical protein